jgi:arsenate reductase-like glutaredoxin family protein
MKKVIFFQESTCGRCKRKNAYLAEARILCDGIGIVKNLSSWGFLGKQIDDSEFITAVDQHPTAYGKLGLSREKESKFEPFRLMLKEPSLIKRKIVIDGDRAHFGNDEI